MMSNNTAIPYEELLTYARKISKFTRPPNARPAAEIPPLPAGTSTANGSIAGPGAPNIKGEANNNNGEPSTRPGIDLTEQELAALDPSSRTVFTPWPSEEVMRRGALAQIAFEGEGIILGPLEQPALPPPPTEEQQQFNGMNGGEAGAGQRGPAAAVEVNGHAGKKAGTGHQRDAEGDRQSKEAAHAAVFSSLDLYDPDQD